MRQRRKIACMFMALCLFAATMSGCVYSNNKSWGDMTSQEKRQVQQSFEDVRARLKEDFSGSSPKDRFAHFILDTVEYAISHAEVPFPDAPPA